MNNLFRNIFLILIILNFIFNQNLILNPSNLFLYEIELQALKEKKVKDEIFISPFIEKKKGHISHINIIKNLGLKSKIVIEPVLALRLGNKNAFEIIPYHDGVFWYTPGVKFQSTIPIITNFKSVWIYSWMNFYKHSAIFENNIPASPDSFMTGYDFSEVGDLFEISPYYSTSFFTKSLEPDYAFDFDQSNGGVSILSNNFKVVFGKFKTNLGPFSRGNLSISNHAPAFNQVFLEYSLEKFKFIYIIGKLNSNIPKYSDYCINDSNESIFFSDHNLYENAWNFDLEDCSPSSLPTNELLSNISLNFNRFIAHHRIDLFPIKNLRIGLYEQVIFGGRDLSFDYLVPIVPFWSIQHELGDTDNIMMGFDLDYIFGNKMKESNRFYASFLVDEWAPYDTFNDNNRNWFAYQIGFSRNSNVLSKDFLFKIEYTKIDPEVYNHRFIINEPKHYGYNIGFWSGRNSEDLMAKFIFILNSSRFIEFGYEHTRFSNDDYWLSLEDQYNNNNVGFLSGEQDYYRKKTYFLFTTLLKYSIFFDIELSNLDVSLNYNNTNVVDNIYNLSLKFRYNIPY